MAQSANLFEKSALQREGSVMVKIARKLERKSFKLS
jgi:hypothetical protein